MDPRSEVRKEFVACQEMVHLLPDDSQTEVNENTESPNTENIESSSTENIESSTTENTVYTIKEDGTLMCNLCGKSYKLLGALKKHLKSNHQLTDIVNFVCLKCKKSFDTKKKLSRHENSKTLCI